MIWGEADAVLGLETLDGLGSCAIPALRRLPAVSHWVQQAAPEG